MYIRRTIMLFTFQGKYCSETSWHYCQYDNGNISRYINTSSVSHKVTYLVPRRTEGN